MSECAGKQYLEYKKQGTEDGTNVTAGCSTKGATTSCQHTLSQSGQAKYLQLLGILGVADQGSHFTFEMFFCKMLTQNQTHTTRPTGFCQLVLPHRLTVLRPDVAQLTKRVSISTYGTHFSSRPSLKSLFPRPRTPAALLVLRWVQAISVG